MGYERDEAMRQQEATEEMISMREPRRSTSHPSPLDACTREVREHAASLVEEMIAERKHPGERMVLAIAARAIRRGRHLTNAEKMENLSKAIAEAEAEVRS